MRVMSAEGLRAAVDKMEGAGVHPLAIAVFTHYYHQLESGATGLVHEADIRPLESPPAIGEVVRLGRATRATPCDATIVIKLNGGLGTGMGMDRAKSLLPVRDELTFLDVIVRQVMSARRAWEARLPLMFMNSFRTRDDTLAALSRYDDLPVGDLPLDILQNREPKLLVDDLTPVEWPEDPSLEWCPPGHGDLYTALQTVGRAGRACSAAGLRYAFVSNADNLGATVDGRVAGWFATSRRAVRERGVPPYRGRPQGRTPGRPAQRRTADPARLGPDRARGRGGASPTSPGTGTSTPTTCGSTCARSTRRLRAHDGVLGLPLIRNVKNVDPADQTSPKVVQIETAMGAAVEVFEGSRALEVDRGRFLPVKSTNDLLAMRSDVYDLADDGDAAPSRMGSIEAPYVDLDPDFYKVLARLRRALPERSAILARGRARSGSRGDWTFGAGVASG